MKSIVMFLIVATASFPAWASDTGGASGAASAGGDGASQGAAPKGFDVSGSHPLPNGSEHEAPGRGGCGCRFTGLTHHAEQSACVAVLAVALARLRRRTVA